MGTYLFMLDVFSGTCCLLSSVFLHFFSYSAKEKDFIYRRGLAYIKIALVIVGTLTLLFTVTDGFKLPCAKCCFIQILLPVESFLVFCAMIHLTDASKRFRKVMVYNGIYASVLCAVSIIACICYVTGEADKRVYYLPVLCYAAQLSYFIYIYLHHVKSWKTVLNKSHDTFRAYRFLLCVEAFAVGLAGLMAELFPRSVIQCLFTIGYTLFFIHFSILYHNYGVAVHGQIKKMLPVLVPDNTVVQQEKTQEKKKLKRSSSVKRKLDSWVAEKKYLHPGVTIQDLSRQIGVNRTYLSEYVNETYHTGFNNWLNSLRIEEAKRKLAQSPDMSLSELAEFAGFADLAHFSKIFKQKEGISPSMWKKKQTFRAKTA